MSLVKVYLQVSFLFFAGSLFADAEPFSSDVEKFSYSIGINIAHDLKGQGVEEIDSQALAKALESYLKGDELLLSRDEAAQILKSELIKHRKALDESILQESEAWLFANSMEEGVIVTESGLQYRVISKGQGAEPTLEDKVKVNYVGSLTDGQVIDQSAETVTFSLDQVIPGWQEGLQLMKEGAKYQFFVHPKLAYAAQGRITPNNLNVNNALIFEVELVAVNP